ncbi:MAG: bacillithiol biosynthesis cysteine-adding enzyme BshC [Bacteroidetes bacterium]|nr:bacillithiol biosynthesis cysteine-adding enzyme BshC [Bacteroidota bacterium]
MKKLLIPFEETGYFSKVVLDYLSESPALKPFYVLPPKLSSFPFAIELKKKNYQHRDILPAILLKQHARLMLDKNIESVIENINSLESPNTFTVTTAHQPNLFLGPLYTIYKAITTILITQKLNETYRDQHFVPVFWLGSEDHDKEELNHIHLFGKTFTWNTAQSGAFGRMSTSSLRPWVQELKDKLGEGPVAVELSQALDDAYVKERTIAAATRKFLYHFFADDGLVVVDGDDAALKRLFLPVLEKEITEQYSFRIVNRSNEKFAIHYENQISPREINLFYLDEGIRERLVREDDGFKVLNTSMTFSREQLLKLLHDSPEKFSPNVILRPVYQETILPDVAVVGGGAEVTYWLQLKPLMEEMQMPFPLVFLRNSVLWIDAQQSTRIQRLQLSPEDLFNSADDIINKFVEQQSGDLISLEEQMLRVSAAFDDAMKPMMLIDPTLKGPFEAEKTRTLKGLEMLEERLRKAAKRRDETAVMQIRNLREKLFPSNSLQERHDNFMSIYSRTGRSFLDELKSALDPFDRMFTVLVEE